MKSSSAATLDIENIWEQVNAVEPVDQMNDIQQLNTIDVFEPSNETDVIEPSNQTGDVEPYMQIDDVLDLSAGCKRVDFLTNVIFSFRARLYLEWVESVGFMYHNLWWR